MLTLQSDTLWWCKNDTATIKDPIDQSSESGSSAGDSASAGGDTSDITNNTPTYSTPTAPDNCTTIFGTGGSSSSWWPLTLRQLVEDLAAAEMPVSEPLFQGSGSFGAVVTVNKNSTQAWHVQLSSVPFPMVAGHYYILKYGVMSSVPAFTQVALVEDKSWEVRHYMLWVNLRVTKLQVSEFLHLAPLRTGLQTVLLFLWI